jgi:two-component system, NarL family, nitrate/nitrite response regulator NarL
MGVNEYLEFDRHDDRPLSVMIVDPLPVVRAGMALLISNRPDLSVIGEASDSDGALERLRKLQNRSDIVVLVGLSIHGEHDAYWLIRQLREEFPGAATLALGANADQAAISRALFVGADGFVDKNAAAEDFLEALATASRGEIVMVGPPEEWLGDIAQGIERQRQIEPLLTERELQVLSIAAEGLTAREIAAKLGLAERTVTTHLTRIYGKLGVSGRVAAIASAAKAGLFALSI